MLGNKVRSFELTLIEESSQLRSDRVHFTKWGVSVKTLRQALAGVDINDLRTLDIETAKAVYESEWQFVQLDCYPSGLDYFMFDACIFYGRAVPVGWLSIALLGRDFCYDDEAIDRIARLASSLELDRVQEVIGLLAFLRRRRDRASQYYKFFGADWTSRVLRVKEKALKLTEEKEDATVVQAAVQPAVVQLSFGF